MPAERVAMPGMVMRISEDVVRRLVLAIVLSLFAAAPAVADLRIVASPGGEVESYLRMIAAMRESGQRIVIDGPCYSACTLLLNEIPANRLCVTRRAVLGFHAARWIDGRGREYAAPEETRLVLAAYPPAVRAWIERRGGLRRKPIFLRGRELAAILPTCR
jgi:hypothetical protein